ncbi:prepilin-type N-terminal cleavage/methylation domain-containing protein [Massilia oculi]|uniref:Prepilin-type N-terminal cleavage/methylation domain-containing protein n=1 Tax=Massilia hydrophila TaxID=3044279 RepID=A0ABS7YDG8_9BURK|nr:prepilin-type N-terminal cleavage/methylation domain-containing protein [Massilia oculi]MCA1857097.1 prepilin-type N-terminal cleavage/methylation domain-containing protein [Massilia oculi]
MEAGKHKESGFTLVEISIVLVIIGLLLGGVLKGQSMIENAKAKALVNEFRAVWTMTNSYKDIFKATPGDDAFAVDHHPNATVSTSKPGDEKIDGGWTGADLPTAANEASLFWQHVRLAGMATGTANSGRARNVVGGPLGITSNGDRVNSPAGVVGQYFICSGNIPGRLARAVDIALDDQIATTGQVFAAKETGVAIEKPTAAVAYEDGALFTVCLAI